MKKYEISPAAKVALKKTTYTIDDIADPPNNGTKYTRAEVINFIKDMKAMIVEKGLGEFSVSNGPMHEGDSILDELTLDTSEVASHAVDLDEPNTIVETFDPIKPTDIDSDVDIFDPANIDIDHIEANSILKTNTKEFYWSDRAQANRLIATGDWILIEVRKVARAIHGKHKIMILQRTN